MTHHLLAAAGLAAVSFLCNLPLGRWRITVKKYSTRWFLAVHISIPLILLLRMKMGLGDWLIPVSISAALAGQLVGGAVWGNKKVRDKQSGFTLD